MNRNDVNRKTWYLLILMPIIYLAVSVLVVFLVKNNGAYPTGSDTMYHIFRGDYVYNSIKEGSWYPIYNSMWYNAWRLCVTGHHLQHIIWHYAR